MTGWHRGPLLAFDTETTSADPTTARLVTASVVHIRPPAVIVEHNWLAHPEVEIPAEATAIHGITTERAFSEGRPAAEVLHEVAVAIGRAARAGTPIIAFNVTYDATLLDHELARHNLPPLEEYCGGTVAPVIDPIVIDRHVDRFRKGKRTLTAACETYSVRLDGAHTAGYDAIAAARLAWRLATLHPEIANADPMELHTRQASWNAEWAEGFQSYLRRHGEGDAVIDGTWPLRAARVGVGP